MIELFDAERLLPRRDRSLAGAGLVMAGAALALAAYAGTLQRELNRAQALKVDLEGQVRKAQARQQPSTTLIADLQRELQYAQAELASAGGSSATEHAAPPPSAWLDRLAALGSAEVSLAKIEIDAQGGTRIEGLAVNPQAVSGFVQAFARHESLAGLKPRAVEVRQDKTQAPHLRFQLRATAPAQAAAAVSTAASGAATAAKGST